jgi:amino acid adenylation domain-containing protein
MEDETSIDYATLDARARALAAQLIARGALGERVLVLHSPGLDYVIALFACLYAGAVAVPAYPPRAGRPLLRLRSIARDASARFALTSPAISERIARRLGDEPELTKLIWVAPESLTEAAVSTWRVPLLPDTSLAILQYTSGSTSDPKGVMLTQAHFLHNVSALVEHGGLIEDDRIVSWLPPYHDMGLLSAILLPVITGTQAVLMSPSAFLQQPLRWLAAISRFRGTISGGPNFAYDLCMRRITPAQLETLDLSCWRVAFSGAERVRADTVERFSATFAASGFRRAAITPCYGLAEATLGVSYSVNEQGPVIRSFDAQELGQGAARAARPGHQALRLVSAGQVLPDSRVRIVNPETMRSVPEAAVGEIWVNGPSVAQGYYGKGPLSERVFRARLAQIDPNNLEFLRTGDLGFLSNGELFITGRIKDLIILRGANHYPEDIEDTALGAHPRLRPGGGAACSVEVEGEERLVIVHEVDATRDLPGEEIAAAVRRAVAEAHELAVHELVLVGPAALEKTSSGKVRRHAIAQSYLAGTLEAVARFIAPSVTALATAPPQMVQRVARLMAEVLNIEAVQPDENFFELGGHSLMATQLASRLHHEFAVDLPLAAIFEAPTPAALAAWVAALPRGEALPALQRLDRGQPLPLSYSQERMWFLHQIEPDGSAYNVAGAVTLEGVLDAPALFAAFNDVIRRHEVLRSNYGARDGTPQVRVNQPFALEFEQVDLSAETQPAARAKTLASALAHRPFDIAHDRLIRGGLYRLGEQSHVLCVCLHHLITDAWSMGVLTREVLDGYFALTTDTKPPRSFHDDLQYADYAAWQRQRFSGARLARDLEYWMAELASVPALELPFDRAPPAEPTSAGGLVSLDLPAELFGSLRELGLRQGSTLFMVMLSALQVVFHRYSGQVDIVLGVPIANRNQVASEPFMGTLVNTLALRVQFEPEATFSELLRETRRRALAAYEHQDLPFERLVAELPLIRNSGRSPLIQAMFDFQNAPLPNLSRFGTPDGVEASFRLKPFVISRGASQFDLSVLIMDTELGQSIGFEYSTDRFTEAAIERLAGHYLGVLQGILLDPEQPISRIPMLAPRERAALLALASRTCVGAPEVTPVTIWIAEQARRTPDAAAVLDEHGSISYAELEQRSDALSSELQRRGAGPGDRVAVYLERGGIVPVALLAVLKTGAAYVPIDPRYPAARIEQVLEDARPRLILTQNALLALLPEALRTLAVCCDAASEATPFRCAELRPEMAAYVIYTSGSTGRPKGVEVSHGGLSNFLRSMSDRPGLTARDRLLSVTTVAFDISGLELFLPLINGASVYVASSDAAADGARLRELVETSSVTIMQATPATWKLLIEAGFTGKAGFKILCGGEALPRDLASQLLQRADSVWNMYGPTETTIWSTVQQVQPGEEPIPIGSPILHTPIYVLDKHRELAPLGALGEIYIGGAGVANGYLHRPDLTQERFFSDPFAGRAGARIYRTGDLGKLRSDGSLEYLGRADQQIKLRGFRIEPGEIEAVLKQQSLVKDAVVVTREDQPGDVRLVAYYLRHAGSPPNAEEASVLRAALARRLPEYMVPSALVALSAFPETPNGKLDRKRLPAPASTDLARAETFVAPRDELETSLEALWRDVLGGAPVGVHDNFFSIGGHSLLAVRLLSRVRKTLAIDLSVAALMKGPTIGLMAEQIRRLESAREHAIGPDQEHSFLIPVRERKSEPRLFCVHGAGGDALALREIGERVGANLSFYALQTRGVDGKSDPFTTIEDMAQAYLEEVREVQPTGPYHLSGYCGGGVVAFEMANRLRAAGESVATLALLDSHRPGSTSASPRLHRFRDGFASTGVRYLLTRAVAFVRRELTFANARLSIFVHRALRQPVPHELRGYWLIWAFFRAEARYRPRVYPGRVTLFRPSDAGIRASDGGPEFGWAGFASEGVQVEEIPGNHDTLLREPHVAVLAQKLTRCVSGSKAGR